VPIPLVDFPPIVRRLLLWVFMLSSLLMQFGVFLSATASIGSFLNEVQAHHCSPRDHRENMASDVFPS
jgi:hypothetical protein